MAQNLQDFYREFNDEVKKYQQDHERTTINQAFKDVFISYLNDNGIDGIQDTQFFEYQRQSENLKIDGISYSEFFQTLTILVAKYNSKYEYGLLWKKDIDNYLKSGFKFYKYCVSTALENLEQSSDGYEAYSLIKDNLDKINTVKILFITNDFAKNYIPEDVVYKEFSIKFDVFDIERLHRIIFARSVETKPLEIKLKDKYDNSLKMIKAPIDSSTYDCYIGAISGDLLAKIYKDEGQALIQKNVRSYLQATGKVNRGIKKSLINEPDMFMAYNNGISTIADSIKFDEDFVSNDDSIVSISEIIGWQIVNGGQTTASIFNVSQSNNALTHVSVQIKLVVIKNIADSHQIASNISKYANSQNKINMSDFNANDDFHIEMENISRKIYIPVEKGKPTEQWFYERARGQYLVELNMQSTAKAKKEFKDRVPKKRCVSKAVAAKCIMAFNGYPYYVSKGLETNFVYFSSLIQEGKIGKPSVDTYIDMISKVILFQACDKIVGGLNFGGFKAQTNYYVMALLGKYYSDYVDTQDIWKKQSISPQIASIIESLAYKVWEHFKNPSVTGVNVGQWCKKEECWTLLQKRFEEKSI